MFYVINTFIYFINKLCFSELPHRAVSLASIFKKSNFFKIKNNISPKRPKKNTSPCGVKIQKPIF